MKKFFSLIAAVLFAGSMMATEVTVSKTVEELATANSWANGTVVTPFALDEVITVSTNASDANTGKYYTSGQQVRLYQSGAAELIISAAEGYTISSITLTYVSQNTGIFVEAESGVAVDFENVQSATFTVGNSGEATNGQARVTSISVTYDGGGEVPPVEPTINYYVIGSMTEWNVEANYKLVANPAVEGEYMGEFTFANNDEFKIAGDDGSQLIWFPGGTDNNFQITEAGDYKITFNPAGNVEGWYAGFFNVVKKEALAAPTNCAEAAAAALSVSANNELYNNGAIYTIEGYVTGIKTAYSDQYHNISFWMADAADGGEVLQAYRAACASEADAPQVGDKVAVTGSLTKYNTTPEFAAGCTYVITEPYIPVEPEINYYVVGSMTSWAINADYKLAANSANEGEFMGEFAFENGAEFKVVSSADGEAIVDWFPAGMNNNYQITEAGDYTVYFRPEGEVEGWHEGYINAVKKEALADPTNCAEAAEAALSVSANNELYNNGAVYTIEGYVTGIKTAYSDQYHNISFWMADSVDGGEVLQAYRAACASEADAPQVGDKVAVTGSLTKYNTTPEFAAACTYVILERATPVEADTITIVIDHEVEYVDMVAAQGWWQFMYEDAEYSISLSNVSTTQAAGVYTVADLDADYTYIEIKATETEVHFVDGSLTLTEAEDGSRTIEGVMTGDDGNIYIIKLVFVIPTAETTVNVEIPEWGIVDASEYYGFAGYIFYGETADKNIYVQITIPGSNPLGTFTYDDLYAGGTGIKVGGDYKSIYSMNITINASDAQRAIVTADILCYNNTLYHVTTTIGEGIEDIDAAVKAIKSIVNGQVVIEKAGKTYNMNGAVIR